MTNGSDTATLSLALLPAEHQLVSTILLKYAPGRRAFAFGSRVLTSVDDRRRLKPHSDLDIALSAPPLTMLEMDDMRDAFSQSDLPMRVDIASEADLPLEWKKRVVVF